MVAYLPAFMLCFLLVAQPDFSVTRLRQLFFESEKTEEAGDAFYNHMKQYKGQEPILVAYKGASEAIRAKYAFNPISKLNHLKTAHKHFERSVKQDGNNPEIRFVRYSVESNTPKAVGMRDHLAADKKLLIDHIQRYPKSGLDAETYKIARNFLLADDDVTDQEKQLLQATRP